MIFAVIASGAGVLAALAAQHELSAHWAASSNPDAWLRAAENEPQNDALWYHLARYRQLDFQHSDLPSAISYYQRAIAMNPQSPFYWADLAVTYETAGSIPEAERAFRKARQLYPASAEVAWRFGNFLLRQRRIPEAFQQIHAALLSEPTLAASAVSICWRSTGDIARILKDVLPDRPDDNWAAADVFVQAHAPEPAMAVWQRITAHRDSFPITRTFGLLDMLIEVGHGDDAQRVWTAALIAAGLSAKAGRLDSLIWNGGFEEEIMNGGFDWRVAAIGGATMGWDEQTFHSGSRSLRVDFDGSANLEFRNVWQYIKVMPATRYRLTAFFRTKDLSTDSGMRLEIRDVSAPANPARYTPNVVGTQAWSEKSAEFLTGPQTTLVEIVLRRSPSAELARIRGTAWIDDVALLPLPSAAVEQQ